MSPGGSGDPLRARARAPAGTRRRALVSGLTAVLMLHGPLAVGYGWLLHRSWNRLLEGGLLPSPEFFTPFPLHWPRMFALSLFSVDVGLWVALVSLLPLGPEAPNVFERARRRLRRRWLIAHAPLVPLIATLVGAHLHARALASNGAGALFFDVRRVATGMRLAGPWVESETLLLVSLTAVFLVHLALLAGVARPMPWLRNMLLALAASWALATLTTAALMPLGAGGLAGASRQAVGEIEAACPGLAGSAVDERIAAPYSAFHRTAADAPALRDQPPWAIPSTMVLLAPLARLPAAGLPVVLDGPSNEPPPAGLAAGFERRVPRRGGRSDLPLPEQCASTRVLKLDRALLARDALEALVDAGPGALRLGFAPVPRDPPRTAPPSPGPRLVLAIGPRRPPAGIPRAALPVEDARQPLSADGEALVGPRAGDPPRLHQAHPRDPPPPATPDSTGRVALDLQPGALWFDVLRAIVAEADAGAREIWLVPPDQPRASSSRR